MRPNGAMLLLWTVLLAGAVAMAAEPPPRSARSAALWQKQIDAARQRLEEDPRDDVAAYRLARALHFLAARGDDKARAEAFRLWQRRYEARPDDAVTMAYHGSALLMAAPHAWMPWRKGELAHEGGRLLDAAVAASQWADEAVDPMGIEAQLVRGLSTAHLPDKFGLRSQSDADLAAVAAVAPDLAESGELDETLAAAAMYHHGLALHRRGLAPEASEAWSTAATRWPDTPGGADAAAALDAAAD